ncbi:nitronate monooxygenase [Arthrobacter cryoconiti]|uniref:Propionate 3-nitronate monooxygenase n=1 Tax=Arthrobacter cryoconiti TaxID=748907 RepID=A0ABV8QYB7_9MICC|nr:nitronate monooxygenase [Arthrobacter cryoconiti]MCC9068249.1 nitronate monooxygenase [Arthrobacter cryoconiti]
MFSSPIVAAPMAGGTTTTALALAAQQAGAFAFAAGGYKTAQALAEHIAALRESGSTFGVNLFVPRNEALLPENAAALALYRKELSSTGARLGTTIPDTDLDLADPRMQDYWNEKIQLLLQAPVPVVSFTFGLPPTATISALKRVGTRVLASVTSVSEAVAAAKVGVDALVVQHSNAGGHSAAFLPAPAKAPPTVVELVAAVRGAVELPLVGAGGIGDAATAKAVLAAGAMAVQLGTALLRTDESGAKVLHKDALADPFYSTTAITRAFTGKPARALVNDFVRVHSATAPHAYPEVHFLTAPLRAGAAAAGDRESLNLWAGTAWRQSQSGPVGNVIREFLNSL